MWSGASRFTLDTRSLLDDVILALMRRLPRFSPYPVRILTASMHETKPTAKMPGKTRVLRTIGSSPGFQQGDPALKARSTNVDRCLPLFLEFLLKLSRFG
jgi:hypothetical protein